MFVLFDVFDEIQSSDVFVCFTDYVDRCVTQTLKYLGYSLAASSSYGRDTQLIERSPSWFHSYIP